MSSVVWGCQDYQNSTQNLYHLWIFMGHWANSSNISPFTIHLPTTFLGFFGLIHADAMRNTCAILIFLGAVCSVDAYHCKAESNQTRSARHEIRVCERRLAIQCKKQNRHSVADGMILKLFLDSLFFR